MRPLPFGAGLSMPKNFRVVFYIAVLAIVVVSYFNGWPSPPPQSNVSLEARPARMPAEPSAPPIRTEGAAPVAPAVKVAMPEITVPDTAALGLRRDTVQGAFEKAPFRLTFDYQPYADGRARMTGLSADGATRLELIGPPEQLFGLALTADMTESNRLAQLRNLNAMGNATKLIHPDWTDAAGWIIANIARAFQNGRAETAMNGNTLKLVAVPNSKLMVLTIIGPVR